MLVAFNYPDPQKAERSLTPALAVGFSAALLAAVARLTHRAREGR